MPHGFSKTRFLFKSLSYYRRMHLAVAAACAVAVAVLAGALLIGDSMRHSLRTLALEGLGRIDHALVSDLFFRETLVSDLNALSRSDAPAPFEADPAIFLIGSVSHAESGARANQVHAIGVYPSFWNFGDIVLEGLELGAFDCALNAALARELRVRPGDEILLRVQKPSAVPRETFLGERDDTVVVLRLTVARVLPASGLGRFQLQPSQQEPLNIFVPLPTLQRRLEREGRINAILASGDGGALRAHLKTAARFEDAGLRLRKTDRYVMFESERIFLREEDARLAAETPQEIGQLLRIAPDAGLTVAYLVNDMRVGDRSIPYSMAAGIGGVFTFESSSLSLEDGEVFLNEWAMLDLQALPGDPIAFTYFIEGEDGFLKEETTTLTLRGVLPMEHPLVDAAFVPEFEGIADADKVAEWDPPFPLDLRRIRPQDEEYWELYRATPKALVTLETARRLWGNRHGDLTALAWPVHEEPHLRDRIERAFDPETAGLSFAPVKEAALRAGQGASDFGMLFIGFSLFLLASAAMLIQILFRLGVEERARQYGLLEAVGFLPREIRLLLLGEGGIVAALGSAIGILLGFCYANMLIYGLNHWWVGSIGTPFLRFAWSGHSLAIGFFGGWLIASGAMWATARALARLPARALLAGRSQEDKTSAKHRRLARWVGAAAIGAAAGLLVVSSQQSAQVQAILFFAGGAALLAGVLAFFRVWLGGDPARSPERLTVGRLGAAAAKRRPGRSLLVAGLIAAATFLIVAVSANRQTASTRHDKLSGTGGFALLAESSLPLYRHIPKMAFRDPDREALIRETTIYPLRLKPGEDASCLNLYRVTRPRILGVDEHFIRRGGFRFASVWKEAAALSEDAGANPWNLLNATLPDGAIPAIGDYTTITWLLRLGLGRDFEMDGVRFRIVALLEKSVFQSELLVSEAHFLRVFPGNSGWRFFAVDAPPGKEHAAEAALEAELEDYGFDAMNAREKLNALLAVENTYLSTFQSLGGLGLLLGTLGLAITLLRNAIERRAEYALLRAVGYRSRDLLRLTMAENALLLLVGMASGTACALLAIAPAAASRSAAIPWGGLSMTLIGIFLLGLLATVLSAAAVLRAPVMQALKEE